MKFGLTLFQTDYVVEQLENRILVFKSNEQKPFLEFEAGAPFPLDCLIKKQNSFYAKVGGHHWEGRWMRLNGAEKKEQPFDGKLLSPFAGRVSQILAAPGQKVDKGEPLMIVEAMKMEYEVTSPVKGEVGEIRIMLGDQITVGQFLLFIKS